MPIPKLKTKRIIVSRRIIKPLIITGSLLLLIIATAWYGLNYFQNRFYPNTTIGGLDVSGLTRHEANEILMVSWNNLTNRGWTFQINDKSAIISPTTDLTEGAALLFALDEEATINQAWGDNRGHYWWQRLTKIIANWLFGRSTLTAINMNENLLTQKLQDNFQSLVTSSQPAKITVNKNGTYQITPETAGQAIDYQSGITKLGQQLIHLEQQPIILRITADQPLIKQAAIGDLQPIIQKYLALTPFTLTASSSSWSINKTTLASWLALEIEGNKVLVGPATSTIDEYLTNNLALEIDQEPQTGQYQRLNNRLTQFRPGKDGLKLNPTTSAQIISQALRLGSSTAALVIEEIKNPLNDSDPSSLGIVELLGTGTSSFAGSPANRIHNIKVGTNQVSGQLIAPDEEFSLVKTLGAINAATGYKTELVIKENKTVPEYGGGLCQVGTTVFRTALASGLPITQRRSHSYRVSYYEPAGTDATIYDPWPDLRFINDTGHYLLILGEVSGNQLSFSLWGTKDGRITVQTKPTIYNIVRPPAKKMTETDSLAPGQIKCTERAHNGADAYFDYTITYPNGEIKDKRFSSHYVPWQEVCLIGKSPTSTTPTTTIPIASTTGTTSQQTTDSITTTTPNTSSPPITN